MTVYLTPHIEIWFDGMEYGYRLDFKDEFTAEALGLEPTIEGTAKNYLSALGVIDMNLRKWAWKLHKENGLG